MAVMSLFNRDWARAFTKCEFSSRFQPVLPSSLPSPVIPRSTLNRMRCKSGLEIETSEDVGVGT